MVKAGEMEEIGMTFEYNQVQIAAYLHEFNQLLIYLLVRTTPH